MAATSGMSAGEVESALAHWVTTYERSLVMVGTVLSLEGLLHHCAQQARRRAAGVFTPDAHAQRT